MGCIHEKRDDDEYNEEDEEEQVFVVSIDSRGRSSSDLETYKEYKCPRSFFEEKIANYPYTICVKSEVAELCGLELKMYFFDCDRAVNHNFHHQHHNHHVHHHNQTVDDMNNIVASLMTFNPDTGHVRFRVHGKAYLVWEDGTRPLSKRQVWGIHELIKEGREKYHDVWDSSGPSDYTNLRKAKLEFIGWCTQYEAGTWSPHAIYEPRHPHHHHHHHNQIHHYDKSRYNRGASGASDQATCHHGENHLHTDCCHSHHQQYRKHRDTAYAAPDPYGLKLKENSRNPLQGVFSSCRS